MEPRQTRRDRRRSSQPDSIMKRGMAPSCAGYTRTCQRRLHHEEADSSELQAQQGKGGDGGNHLNLEPPRLAAKVCKDDASRELWLGPLPTVSTRERIRHQAKHPDSASRARWQVRDAHPQYESLPPCHVKASPRIQVSIPRLKPNVGYRRRAQ